MRRSLIALCLSLFAIVVASATSLSASVISPIGLVPGSQYQLIFVTADKTPASSQDIADYNTFVTNEAALGLSLPAATWSAVASTVLGIAANVNAPSGGLPVYNTQGIQVATGAGIYTGSLLSPVAYDQYGNAGPLLVWAGSNPDGSPVLGSALGDNFVAGGFSTNSDAMWIIGSGGLKGNPNALYALSGPITFVPEPGSLALLGSALLALAGLRALRGNRRA